MELIDFEIGVMEKRNRDDQVIGVQVWYRAGAMRPLSATGTSTSTTGPRPVRASAAN
jgi:hypothetical protein